MDPLYLQRFFHVAKYRGMSEALPHLPIKTNISALSRQMARLEHEMGLTLFERRPFALTAAGQALFEEIQAHYEGLPGLRDRVHDRIGNRLAVGAREVVLRNFLKPLFQSVREQFPGIHIGMRDGDQASLEQLLRERAIHIAATIFDYEPIRKKTGASSSPSLAMEEKVGEPSRSQTKGPSDGFHVRPLLKLPLVLMLPPKCKWKSAEELWKNGNIEPKIICLPDKHSITRHFREGLEARGITDFSVMEMETVELIETYVREQYGVGLTVAVPNLEKIKGLRILPLDGFAPVTFGLLWQQEPNPQMKAFIEAAIRYAQNPQNR